MRFFSSELPAWPGHESALRAKMSSVRYVHLAPLLTDVLRYLNDGGC